MEYIVLGIVMTFVVILLAYVANRNYWQAYNNSKFIDEVLNEQRVHAESSKEPDNGTPPTV